MAKQIDNRLANAVRKFAADYEKTIAEVYGGEEQKDYALAEDVDTYYRLDDIKVMKTVIKWTTTYSGYFGDTYQESESDENEIREWLKKWRADMRRARRYWGMSCEAIDAISNGDKEDPTDNED